MRGWKWWARVAAFWVVVVFVLQALGLATVTVRVDGPWRVER